MLPNENLNRVYLDSRPALQRFLTLATNCPETAADLVQELYLRLPSLKPVPPSESAIRAWLFRVAANLANDNFRKKRRHAELLTNGYTNDSIPIISNHTPEDFALHQDQLDKLQTILTTLPPICAQVLFLSRIEGLTHQAIAERLGISKSWVEKQLVNALNQLRQSISDE